MPTENNMEFATGTIYFNGDYEHGIAVKDGVVTVATVEEDVSMLPYVEFRSSGSFEMEVVRDSSRPLAASIIEACDFVAYCIQWIYDQCPNRRVAYLSCHGKTKRVALKNFRRAVKLVEEKFIRIGKGK